MSSVWVFFLLGSSPAFLLICLRGIGRDWNALAGETNEVANESTQTLGGARSHLSVPFNTFKELGIFVELHLWEKKNSDTFCKETQQE